MDLLLVHNKLLQQHNLYACDWSLILLSCHDKGGVGHIKVFGGFVAELAIALFDGCMTKELNPSVS